MKKYKGYTPYQISSMSDAEIRKAYSRLRSIANKRLNRLQEQDLNMTARTGYRFPTIAQVEESSKFTVASQLADVSKFLRDERTTVTGEKKFIADFREMMMDKGYADLVSNTDDIYNTLQFLEEMREGYNDKLYSSGDLLDTLQEAERLKIPKDKLAQNIDIFVAHLDDLETIKPTKGGRAFSSSRIKALVKKWTK